MSKTNIFTVGGTVQAGRGIYLPRSVDDQLLRLCRAGTFSFVLTARQMGKSSLMVHTAQRLAEEKIRSVIIDLSQLGVHLTLEAWYLGLLTILEDSLDLVSDAFDWWAEHDDLGTAQRLILFFQEVVLREVEGRVVVFIDEIDTTLDLPFTDDFFAAIRYIYNARSQVADFERLSFVMIGVAMPNELINDPRRTPFNIGQRVDVAYFTPDEVLPLATGFALPAAQARQVLDWIFKWTRGHPFLTQRLCRVVADRHQEAWTEAEIDAVVAETFFGEKGEQDSNLQFVRDMLTRRAPDRLAVLRTYRRVRINRHPVRDQELSLVTSHLKLSGIVQRHEGFLEVSNRIYERAFDVRWIREHWPEHWIRRIPPWVLASTAVLIIALALIALLQSTAAERQRELRAEADSLSMIAEDSAWVAQEQRRLALASAEEAQHQRQIAEQSARSAQEQRRLALASATEAERQRQIAVAARDSTIAALNLAEEQRLIAVDSARVAQQQRSRATQARLQTLGLALANEAVNQHEIGDDTLGALLAREAFLFNERSGGAFLNEVYDALRQTLNGLASGRGGPTIIGRHDDWVNAVAYSPVDDWVASGGNDGHVYLWSPDTQKALPGDQGLVQQLAFGPEGRRLDVDGVSWDLETMAPQGSRRESRTSAAVEAISPDGRLRATGMEDGTVRLLDGATNAEVAVLRGHQGPVTTVAFSPDGSLLASGSGDRTIRMWQIDPLSRKPVILKEHTHWVHDLAFNGEGNILVSGSADRTVRRWQIDAGALADDVCNVVGRSLNREEWNQFVGEDISFSTYVPCVHQQARTEP